MKIKFHKYHGCGNDFIIIDNRNLHLKSDNADLYRQWCDRHFGIGADGIIFLQNHASCDFEMIYLNADGHESSMCGNGGRCIVAFAKEMGLIGEKTDFVAVDGPHKAEVLPNGWVSLQMKNVEQIEVGDDYFFLDTGSPHFIRYVPDTNNVDIIEAARKIRYNDRFAKEGTNVNFITQAKNTLIIRTYERGVEDETLACGTGVTAAAISYAEQEKLTGEHEIKVKAAGGDLSVRLNRTPEGKYTHVWLTGPAVKVFEGVVTATD